MSVKTDSSKSFYGTGALEGHGWITCKPCMGKGFVIHDSFPLKCKRCDGAGRVFAGRRTLLDDLPFQIVSGARHA
jgi:DnaJ-class molecular chaperone